MFADNNNFERAIALAVLLVAACSGPKPMPASTSGSAKSGSDVSSAVLPVSDSAIESLQNSLLSVDTLGASFQWRQRVTARFGDKKQSFEAVLSKQPGQLQLLGLGPMGTVGFVLQLNQSDKGRLPEVEFSNRSPISFPFDPRYILLDIQRVYYPWLEALTEAEGKRPSLSRQGQVRGQAIVETWQLGRLEERRFSALSNTARSSANSALSSQVVVSYSGWQAGQVAAARVVLQDPQRGYELVIETLEEQVLTP